MLDINAKLPAVPAVDPLPSAAQAKAATVSISKKGTMVILSPDALKLSRDLQAAKNDPDRDPAARMDASVQLRQMAAQILTEK
mgnify:CR=1 FL=1